MRAAPDGQGVDRGLAGGKPLVIRPLGVAWERLDRPPRVPRGVALFWPVLPAIAWLLGLLALSSTFWALYGAAVWLLLSLPLTAHPRLLRQLRLRDGMLAHRLEWGVTHRIPVGQLSQAVICQLTPLGVLQSTFPRLSGVRFGRDPRLYLLDGQGGLRMRIRLTYFPESELERLLQALQLPVSRLGVVSAFEFEHSYPGVLLRFRTLGDPRGCLLSGCGVMAAIAFLAVLGALIGAGLTAPSR